MSRLATRPARLLSSLGRAARFARQQGVGAALRRLRAGWLPLSPVPGGAYRSWLQQPRPAEGGSPRASEPRISLLVPLHASVHRHVEQLYASVRDQAHGNWQLCFSADGPLPSEVAALLAELEGRDSRVRLVRDEASTGISAATNAALRLATGELVGLLDHDDLLAPGALASVARIFHEDPELDLVYTDEDMLSRRGRHSSPLLKPGPSPMLLLGTNYVMHLVVMRRRLLEELGGLRPSYDGAQDHDLLLRCFERARRVKHLCLIGYHWRESATSVASGSGAKPWAYERGRAAVEDACGRRRIPASAVKHSAIPGVFELELQPLEDPLSIHVVLNGDMACCDRWSRVLRERIEGIRLSSVSLCRWPEDQVQGESVLVVDARLRPNPAAVAKLARWTGVSELGAVGSAGRSRWMPASTGFSLLRDGKAQSVPALTLHARVPHEVAALDSGLLLLSAPSPARMRMLRGRAFEDVDALCMSLAVWAEGRHGLFVPIPDLRPKLASTRRSAGLDLAASSLWKDVAKELPADFWSGGADRFGRRHPLLTPLGMPPPAS